MILLALAAAAATANPRPADLKTFKDWIVGCDNVRSCQANALGPESGDDFLMLVLSRSGNPADAAVLSVPLPEKATPGARFTLEVDGTQIAEVAASKDYSASLRLTRPILAALANGSQIALVDGKQARRGETSLSGLSAAMLFIDDQQRRIGTTGALKAVGTKPDTTVPAPPLAPLIAVPPVSPKPPRTITVAAATKLIGPDSATCDYASSKVAPRSYRLDAAHSLVLIDHPCGNGAYNYFTSVYVLDESGPPRPAQFDLAPGMGESSGDGTGDLTNGDWDAKTRSLSSYEKGRGLGDCGSSESFVWDGRRFRLTEQSAMGECRGSNEFIRVWTARTK